MKSYINFKTHNEMCIITEYSDNHMYILGEFFRCEVGNILIKYWIAWLQNNDEAGTCGNWIWLDKINDELVIAGDGTMEPYDGISKISPDFLIINKNELIKLLYKWEELYAKKAYEIMITKDGDTFDMFEVKSEQSNS